MTTLAAYNVIDTETAETASTVSSFEMDQAEKIQKHNAQKKAYRKAASTRRFIASAIGLLAILTLEPLYK